MLNIFRSHIFGFCCCVLNSTPCGSDRLIPSTHLLSSSRWWTLLPPLPPLPLPNSLLNRLFLRRECLYLNAFPVTGLLILKNIGCTDSPQLLCFGGIRRSQWMASWILIASTVCLLLPLPRQKRNAHPEVSLRGKTRKMAHWRLFCRRIHCGTKRMSAIFDAGTGIIHGKEIPREVSSSIYQFPAIGSICLRKVIVWQMVRS